VKTGTGSKNSGVNRKTIVRN